MIDHTLLNHTCPIGLGRWGSQIRRKCHQSRESLRPVLHPPYSSAGISAAWRRPFLPATSGISVEAFVDGNCSGHSVGLWPAELPIGVIPCLDSLELHLTRHTQSQANLTAHHPGSGNRSSQTETTSRRLALSSAAPFKISGAAADLHRIANWAAVD